MTTIDRSFFTATADLPVTVYYCKSNLKTGKTVRIVQGHNVNDCAGVTFSSSLATGPFDAEMMHGNSTGRAKKSGARCVLLVRSGIVTPVEGSTKQETRITAAELQPGDEIHRTGSSPGATHNPPVTVVRTHPDPTGKLTVVHGFNRHNTEPRLMFRGLLNDLPLIIRR